MLYAIYLRKSRADLEAEAMGQGETLARHRAALLDYAAHHGLEIGAVYEEIISGESIDARPKMKQLLQEVEQGRWAGVLCMDIDRLARGNSADQARVSNTFRISGTLIITPSKVYDQSRESDEEYVDFELFMARREYKAISRRIMRGRIASVKEGHFIGSTPPYGYDKVKVEKGRGFTLSPNYESDIVKQIYSMCISGMGCNAIARRLDMMGVTPRKGSSWSSASDSGYPEKSGLLRQDTLAVPEGGEEPDRRYRHDPSAGKSRLHNRAGSAPGADKRGGIRKGSAIPEQPQDTAQKGKHGAAQSLVRAGVLRYVRQYDDKARDGQQESQRHAPLPEPELWQRIRKAGAC